jgi:hypothetical protein
MFVGLDNFLPPYKLYVPKDVTAIFARRWEEVEVEGKKLNIQLSCINST